MSKYSGEGMDKKSSSELMLSEHEIWVGMETKSEFLIETSKETVCYVRYEEYGKDSDFVDALSMVDVSSSLRMDWRTQG